MLARIRRGNIHAEDCFCCNDGFWKTKPRDRGRIRKQNRAIEKTGHCPPRVRGNSSVSFRADRHSAPLFAELGRSLDSGAVVEVDLSRHRCGLLTGNTGSGKTVLLRQMMRSLSERYSAEEVQFAGLSHRYETMVDVGTAAHVLAATTTHKDMSFSDSIDSHREDVDRVTRTVLLEMLRRDAALSKNPNAEFPYLVLFCDHHPSMSWERILTSRKDLGVRVVRVAQRIGEAEHPEPDTGDGLNVAAIIGGDQGSVHGVNIAGVQP